MAVFRVFEHDWDEEVLKFWRPRSNRTLAKKLFSEIFTQIWNRTMIISNIQSDFRKCGVCPFDDSVIPDHAFAPSDLTHIAVSDERQEEVPLQLPLLTQEC